MNLKRFSGPDRSIKRQMQALKFESNPSTSKNSVRNSWPLDGENLLFHPVNVENFVLLTEKNDIANQTL
jgi:hypothetical protein